MKYIIALLTLVSTSVLASGFTPVNPSPDSRLIYVSSSQGSDSNDCLSAAAPCSTISAGASKMRAGYPDHLYLKAGDVWRESRIVDGTNASGRSATERAVITSYGTGPRPRIEASEKVVSIFKDAIALNHVAFQGLHFYAYRMDPKHAEFDGTSKATFYMINSNTDVLLEDNKLDFIEVIVQGAVDGTTGEMKNPKDITFRRNIWTGAYYSNSSHDRNSRPSNIFANHVDGLVIEENVLDRGGWNPDVAGAGANMYNHNLYLQYYNVGNRTVVRNNIITRASSHGVQLRAGGLLEGNFFGRNAVGANFGYKAHPIDTGAIAHAFNNVITEGHSMIKGIDACTGVNLCTEAVYGLLAPAEEIGNADFKSAGNLIHSHSPDDKQTRYASLSFKTLGEDVRGWEQGKYNQARTLGDYNAALGGINSFDAFMSKALNRQAGEWPEELTAVAINAFIQGADVVQPQADEPIKTIQLLPLQYTCEMTCTAK